MQNYFKMINQEKSVEDFIQPVGLITNKNSNQRQQNNNSQDLMQDEFKTGVTLTNFNQNPLSNSNTFGRSSQDFWAQNVTNETQFGQKWNSIKLIDRQQDIDLQVQHFQLKKAQNDIQTQSLSSPLMANNTDKRQVLRASHFNFGSGSQEIYNDTTTNGISNLNQSLHINKNGGNKIRTAHGGKRSIDYSHQQNGLLKYQNLAPKSQERLRFSSSGSTRNQTESSEVNLHLKLKQKRRQNINQQSDQASHFALQRAQITKMRDFGQIQTNMTVNDKKGFIQKKVVKNQLPKTSQGQRFKNRRSISVIADPRNTVQFQPFEQFENENVSQDISLILSKNASTYKDATNQNPKNGRISLRKSSQDAFKRQHFFQTGTKINNSYQRQSMSQIEGVYSSERAMGADKSSFDQKIQSHQRGEGGQQIQRNYPVGFYQFSMPLDKSSHHFSSTNQEQQTNKQPPTIDLHIQPYHSICENKKTQSVPQRTMTRESEKINQSNRRDEAIISFQEPKEFETRKYEELQAKKPKLLHEFLKMGVKDVDLEQQVSEIQISIEKGIPGRKSSINSNLNNSRHAYSNFEGHASNNRIDTVQHNTNQFQNHIRNGSQNTIKIEQSHKRKIPIKKRGLQEEVNIKEEEVYSGIYQLNQQETQKHRQKFQNDKSESNKDFSQKESANKIVQNFNKKSNGLSKKELKAIQKARLQLIDVNKSDKNEMNIEKDVKRGDPVLQFNYFKDQQKKVRKSLGSQEVNPFFNNANFFDQRVDYSGKLVNRDKDLPKGLKYDQMLREAAQASRNALNSQINKGSRNHSRASSVSHLYSADSLQKQGAEKVQPSKRFQKIHADFMNAEAIKIRKAEARKQEKDALYHTLHVENAYEQNRSMKKHQKSLKKMKRQKVLRQRKELEQAENQTFDSSNESYKSSESAKSSSCHTNSDVSAAMEEAERLKNEKYIFEEEIQGIRQKLEDAVGIKLDEATDVDPFDNVVEPVEMSENQKQRCVLLVQMFFADMGNSLMPSLEQQARIAEVRRKRRENQAKRRKKEARRIFREAVLSAKEQQEKGVPMMLIEAELNQLKEVVHGLMSNEELEAESSENEEEESSTQVKQTRTETENSQAKMKQKKSKTSQDEVEDENEIAQKKELEKVGKTFKTDTQVQKSSLAQRSKLDTFVNKIMLFKGYRASDARADMDYSTKQIQTYVRKTIQNYSSSFTAPAFMEDNKLTMNGYYINERIASSLAGYFNSLKFNNLTQLTLHENGLTDQSGAQLLAGVSDLKALKKLRYSSNQLGQKTAEEIVKMLEWPAPLTLKSLQLENLKTSHSILGIVLQALKENKTMQCLHLSKIPLFSARNFQHLHDFLAVSKSLQDLKLSWNAFTHVQLNDMISEIVKKKSIMYLDLSWNNMKPRKNTTETERFVDNMRRFILTSKIFHLDLTGMQIGKPINKLIEACRASQTLGAIHLSQNHIPTKVLLWIDQRLSTQHTMPKIDKFRPIEPKKEKFTESSELGSSRQNFGNTQIQTSAVSPRQTDQTQGEIKQLEIGSQDSSAQKNLLNVPLNPHKLNLTPLRRSRDSVVLRPESSREFAANIQRSKMQKKDVKKKKQLAFEEQEDFQKHALQDPLIYNRIINHPEVVFPQRWTCKMNAGKRDKMNRIYDKDRMDTVYFDLNASRRWIKIVQWNLKTNNGIQPDIPFRHQIVKNSHTNCWVCEKRKYVLMSINMEKIVEQKQWGEPINLRAEIRRIENAYLPKGQLPGNLKNYPILVSSLNDWFPVHLIPSNLFAMLHDYKFAKLLCGDDTPHKETPDNVKRFQVGYQKILDHISGDIQLDDDKVGPYTYSWRNTILKNLIYQQDTLFIDFPQSGVGINPERLFMYAGWVKPGKHRSFLFDPVQQRWFSRDFFVDPRSDEEFPQFANVDIGQAKKIQLNSVLKEWKRDTKESLKKCFTNDDELWKFNKSTFIKDYTDQVNIKELIFANYQTIKDLFVTLAAQFSFPRISMIDSIEIARKMGLIEQRGEVLIASDIERAFIGAARSDSDTSSGGQKSLELNRSAFIEFLVRVAQIRESSKGRTTTTKAFERLLKDVLLPFCEENCHEYTSYREKLFKGGLTDHLLFANRDNLDQIFVKYCKNSKQKTFDLITAQAYSLILDLKHSDAQIRKLFALSKQTVENEGQNPKRYTSLSYIEFVEFTVRLVYSKMEEEKREQSDDDRNFLHLNPMQLLRHEEHLRDNVARILQELIQNNGMTLVDPDEEDSQLSHYEYDLASGYESKASESDKSAATSDSNLNSSFSSDETLMTDSSAESEVADGVYMMNDPMKIFQQPGVRARSETLKHDSEAFRKAAANNLK